MLRLAILGSRGYPSTYGGYETLVRRLAPYIRDQGHDTWVYGRGTLGRAVVGDVDGIHTVAARSVDRKSLSTVTSGLSSALDARRRRFDAALVLNCANGVWLPVLRHAQIPVAVNVDGLEWERGKWGRVAREVFWRGAKATAKSADVIIADSVEIGRVWADLFGVQSRFIPYGADLVTEMSVDKISALGIAPQSYVLAVARLVPENNVELLLDGLDAVDADVPVVIVGSANYDSPVATRVRAFSDHRPHTHALGHVDDQELLGQLWFHAGVYFHGHSVGGTNPALLQALGAGSPTLALDNPFNREVIGHDDQLLPHDPEAVGAAVVNLLTDGQRRTEFAQRGRTTIAERYLWDDVCASYLEVLVDLAGSED
jgi:glycosyltransferase involved in cell wall biosynthesis